MLRRKLFCAGVMLTATVAGLLVLYFATAPRVTVENYQKINDGMVLADVESILGKPGSRVSNLNYTLLPSMLGQQYAAIETTDEALHWHDNRGSIVIGFSPGGTVNFKRFDPRQDEPPFDRLRRWLGV